MKNEQSTNIAPLTHIKHLEDLDFAVVAEPHGHYVDFKVYEIAGEDEQGGFMYQQAGADYSPAPVATLEESELYLHGSVTWDGCSNWYFDQQERVMLHGCSRQDLTRLGEIMARCWDWAKELLPNFDDLADDQPDVIQIPREIATRILGRLEGTYDEGPHMQGEGWKSDALNEEIETITAAL